MQEFLSDASIVAALDIESGIVFLSADPTSRELFPTLWNLTIPNKQRVWANVVAMPTPGGCRSTC